MAKGLKLKVRKFWGLNPTFIEVIGEKLVGGLFAPPLPCWIGLKLASTSFSDGFHQEIKPLNKRKQFPLDRESVSTSLSEGFCSKILFHQTKITGRGLWKMEKEWFPQAKKAVVHLSNLSLAGIFFKKLDST